MFDSKRLFQCSFALLLSAAAITPQASADAARDSFCHGYIRKALGETPIDGVDRRNLWLAWHETVQTALIEGRLQSDEAERGEALFASQLADADSVAMEGVVEGKCELGKNRTWRWW